VTSHLDAVASAFEVVEVRSPTAYAWFGRVFDQLPPEARAMLEPEERQLYLTHVLADRLYRDFYWPGRPRPADDARERPPRPAVGFVAELQAANTGTGCIDPGWTVTARRGHRYGLEKGGVTLWAAPGELVAPGIAQRKGDEVGVLMPAELLRRSPGFYLALGNHGLRPEAEIVRLYFNVASRGAPRLLARLTGLLNDAGIPFQLKVLDDPAAYTRCDPAVLYVHAEDGGGVEELALDLCGTLVGDLRDATPALTRRLDRGLSFAEDAGDGQSFGMSRCRLLAGAIVAAHALGDASPSAMLDRASTMFDEQGLSLERPYLGPRALAEGTPGQ
jgi:hypothetical protein